MAAEVERKDLQGCRRQGTTDDFAVPASSKEKVGSYLGFRRGLKEESQGAAHPKSFSSSITTIPQAMPCRTVLSVLYLCPTLKPISHTLFT
jgi:hypothetical protein